MAVSTTTTKIQYTGTGAVSAYAVNFEFIEDDDLVVIQTDLSSADTTLVLDTDYTVSGGAGSTGTVTLTSNLQSGFILTIERQTDLTQNTDYVENDPFPAETHEDALDKLTYIAQEAKNFFEGSGARALVYPASESTATSNILPSLTARKSKYLFFDTNGEPAAALPTSASLLDEDNLVSNSDVNGVTQQSVKAYIDNKQTWRNLAINGGFSVWQQGTSVVLNSGTPNSYQADQWIVDIGTSPTGSVTYSKQTFDYNSIPSGIVTQNYARLATDASYALGTNGYLQALTRIENVKRLIGRKVKISFYAQASQAGAKVGLHASYNYGSGGSVEDSASTLGTTVQHVDLTTSWAKYTFTVDFPTVTGKTFGADNTSYGQIVFNFATQGTHRTNNGYSGDITPIQSCNYDIAQVQVEYDTLSAFEQRPFGLELALCERYYQAKQMNVDSYDTAGGIIVHYSLLPVNMRISPTITENSPSSTNLSSIGFSTSNDKALLLDATVVATGSYSYASEVKLDARL